MDLGECMEEDEVSVDNKNVFYFAWLDYLKQENTYIKSWNLINNAYGYLNAKLFMSSFQMTFREDVSGKQEADKLLIYFKDYLGINKTSLNIKIERGTNY